jgi:hypothetical protein
MPSDSSSSRVRRADYTGKAGSGVKQTAGFARIDGTGGGGVYTPGIGGQAMAGCANGNCGPAGPGGPSPYGPMEHRLGMTLGHGGILPVPGMGPPGAVAAVGAMGPNGSMYPPMYSNQRTSIRFANPAGMKITWQGPGGAFVEPVPLEAPARYNFPQTNIYRLRLSGIPNRPGKVYYPTLEVYPATPETITFLSHNTVPVSFRDEEFEQVNSNNMVTKVIYLPRPAFQDLVALGGADELVYNPLEPGVDPVAEANRRGTILAVIRMGNIDLQDPNTPAMDSPTAHVPGLPPGARVVPNGAPKLVPPPGTPAPLPSGVKPAK